MERSYEEAFNEVQLENIQAMYNEAKKMYGLKGHAEIALVFLACADEHSNHYKYNTEEGSYRVAEDRIVESAGHKEPYRMVDTQNCVDELKAEARRRNCDKYRTTSLHNHRTSAFFGYVDIYTFLREESAREMYLDASTYICCLIKQKGRGFTQDKADEFLRELDTRIKNNEIENAKRFTRAFEVATSIEKKLEETKFFGEQRDLGSKRRFSDKLESALIQETRDQIYDETLTWANERLGNLINWVRIPKVELAKYQH